MNRYKLLSADLTLFEGDGGSAAGAEGTATTGEASADATSADTGRKTKKGEYDNVLFGIQDEEQSEPEAESTESETDGDADHQEPSTKADRNKAFKDLINGEYKDLFAAETQRIIDKRFKQTKTLEADQAKARPLYEALATKYGLDAGDIEGLTKAVSNDNSFWQEAADDAGMTVEQYKEVQKIKAKNEALERQIASRQSEEKAQAQLNKWSEEAQELKKTFPTFDLNQEAQNPDFVALLEKGLPVEHAFKVIHYDDIISEAMKTTAAAAEKRTADNIKSRGSRPAENGAAARSAFVIKSDPSKWTKADRAEIARRVGRGEVIKL